MTNLIRELVCVSQDFGHLGFEAYDPMNILAVKKASQQLSLGTKLVYEHSKHKYKQRLSLECIENSFQNLCIVVFTFSNSIVD